MKTTFFFQSLFQQILYSKSKSLLDRAQSTAKEKTVTFSFPEK